MDLDELERLLKAATAGPWQLDSSFQDEELLAVKYVSADGMNFYIADEVGGRRKGENFEDESECIANAQLIAALRNCAEELIRDARRWRHAKAVAMIDSHGGFVIHPDEDPFDDSVTGSALEKQIDAAIAQEQP